MMRTALATVIFPANLPYLPSFLKAVSRQTFREFELLIFNDGVKDLEKNPALSEHKVQVLDIAGTPLQIRLQAMDTARQMGFEKVIFNDSDDLMSENRVEVVNRLLDAYAIVSNDLDLIDAKDGIIEEKYWSSRFEEDTRIDSRFLQDKNIIGFGNTGLRMDVPVINDLSSSSAMAPDWLFFSLLAKDHEAFFSKKCTTLYRQHGNNIIGLKTVDAARIQKVVETKLVHYQLLADLGFDTAGLIAAEKAKQDLLTDNQYLGRAVARLNDMQTNFFWWEETNYIDEKD